MHDETSLPLTLTNIILALLVIGAVLYVASGPLLEILARLRKRRAYEAELNHDMEEMFPPLYGTAVMKRPSPGARRKVFSFISRAWHRLRR